MKKINKKNIILISVIVLILIISIVCLLAFLNKNKGLENKQNMCKISGCSGQICTESDSNDIITTCEWKKEYSCYKKAKCEKQENGKCGFTKDVEFKKCIDDLMPKIGN